MSQNSIVSIGPMELAAAALSLPLVSLVIALPVAGIIRFVSQTRGEHRRAPSVSDAAARSVRTRYLPELRALSFAAIAVVVLFAVENVVRGYLLDLADIVSWWRYATPVFCASLGIAVALALVLFRGTTAPEAPVLPAARRTWTSFGPRAGIVAACVALLVLLATTVAAGLASSADGQGRYIWLEIPVPNEEIDPLRPWFYGWAYGVPVLICLAALTVVSWAILRRNAARPYIRPETVATERDARREVAASAVHIATAGMLLALAGAWRLIAGAGSISRLVIDDESGSSSYDATWRYAEFALAAGWFAPALEIAAFVLLLLVAVRPRHSPAPESRMETDVRAGAETVR